jgi:hypothetical protein
MTKEQLEELNAKFDKLKKLRGYIDSYIEGDLNIRVNIRSYREDDEILNKIIEKYTVAIIGELKEEIKKREKELDGISILQLDKLT